MFPYELIYLSIPMINCLMIVYYRLLYLCVFIFTIPYQLNYPSVSMINCLMIVYYHLIYLCVFFSTINFVGCYDLCMCTNVTNLFHDLLV